MNVGKTVLMTLTHFLLLKAVHVTNTTLWMKLHIFVLEHVKTLKILIPMKPILYNVNVTMDFKITLQMV
jgi:hypothetical protein